MCTGFGHWWCKDDPNLVNLAADRCFSSGSDKVTYCNDFEFVRNPLLCETQNLTASDQCDQFLPGQMKYNRPWTGEATPQPRTSCGFFLNQYSAFLDIKWSYPLTLYFRDYKTVRYDDTEYII